MKEKKKWKVEFSDEFVKELEEISDDVSEEIENLIKGFKSGDIDPTRVGHSVDWMELGEKLICPDCESREVEWLLDKNSSEVDFHCLECSESFWMTYDEYKDAIKRNPDRRIS
ncbi:hypothetical protein CMI42_00155 [Candidatus Pacearchaeota archaeon]|jgi:hypothetical protein|nr:hypothetical protein [Candidatus Pacearchaeota archaeon]|tara:strand:- start:497 stop:835 length:339 start_codon:yes stop_codon:yes gene_type:complete